jgi:hypothetical protein
VCPDYSPTSCVEDPLAVFELSAIAAKALGLSGRTL